MTVRHLINHLLNFPMDDEVKIVFVDENYDYQYQDVLTVIDYEKTDEVGMIGDR